MRARKRFGQHFLEAAWARKVVDAIAPSDADTFLEIGPGRGALTRPLASRAGRVVAVELDRDLAAELEAEHLGGLTVVQGDFLLTDVDTLGLPADTRVAGNLPYNVSSPILIRLLELSATPHRLSRRHGDAAERGRRSRARRPRRTGLRSACDLRRRGGEAVPAPDPSARGVSPDARSHVSGCPARFLRGAAGQPVPPPSARWCAASSPCGGRCWRTPWRRSRPASIGSPRLFSIRRGWTGGGVRRRWRSTSWCGWRSALRAN